MVQFAKSTQLKVIFRYHHIWSHYVTEKHKEIVISSLYRESRLTATEGDV